MKRKETRMAELLEALPAERAGEILGDLGPTEEVSAERVKEQVRGRAARGRKKRGLLLTLSVAAAAVLLTAGVWAAVQYRTARVETEKPFNTVIRFEKDGTAGEKAGRLYAVRPGKLPAAVTEEDSAAYIDYLAYWFGEKSAPEDGDETRIPLGYDELEKRFGVSAEALNGTYKSICVMDDVTATRLDGDEENPVFNARIINIDVYSGAQLDLPYVLHQISGVESEYTTFEGRQAVRIAVHGHYRMELSWLKEDVADECKYLIVYYEEEDTLLVISESREFGEVEFSELEEIARGITLVDTGIDSASLPEGALPYTVLGNALG